MSPFTRHRVDDVCRRYTGYRLGRSAAYKVPATHHRVTLVNYRPFECNTGARQVRNDEPSWEAKEPIEWPPIPASLHFSVSSAEGKYANPTMAILTWRSRRQHHAKAKKGTSAFGGPSTYTVLRRWPARLPNRDHQPCHSAGAIVSQSGTSGRRGSGSKCTSSESAY
jgi:hypothetical protein